MIQQMDEHGDPQTTSHPPIQMAIRMGIWTDIQTAVRTVVRMTRRRTSCPDVKTPGWVCEGEAGRRD